MGRKKGYKKVSKKELQMVHAMRDAGMTKGRIRKAAGRSYSTINNILKAENWKDYKRILKELGKERARQREERKKKASRKSKGDAKTKSSSSQEEILREILEVLKKTNTNIETLGNFVINVYNRESTKKKLKKNKWFNVR